MDPHLHFPTHGSKATSLYGFDLAHYCKPDHLRRPAHDIAREIITHGGIYPWDCAIEALGLYDRAAIDVLKNHREVVALHPSEHGNGPVLAMYVNNLGRLHIRPAAHARIIYGDGGSSADVANVIVDAEILSEIDDAHAALEKDEAEALAEIRAAMDRLHREAKLSRILEEVIDHVEHVESVGFYLGDKFLALIDRYVNLIDDKGKKGFLTALRDRAYEEWACDEVLAVAALHALFLSGRSVRFEEFNGVSLTARGLLTRLHHLAEAYRNAGCEVEMAEGLDLFERARVLREQSLCAPGKQWLRYRWIYGLNFQKTERIMPSSEPPEAADAWSREFSDDYRELVSNNRNFMPNEHAAMMLLANACLARDVAGIACDRGSSSAQGWLEYLMEKTVASAVRATNADYGMSSSLRDIGALAVYDEGTLVERIHALTPAHFFTCFVSNNMVERLGEEESALIASSVQKRMMFNRWHFVPGNLDRHLVRKSRHWYYPPVVPDIAIHSDMHRAAHNKARVKYSIRCPGPDMSRPPLNIGNVPYRGFYDVRVVRMEGVEFSLDDILLTRRRTLWLEPVYAALTAYLMSPASKRIVVKGFQAGSYFDLPAVTGPSVAARPAAVRPRELKPITAD
jgi:hypothetical protein